MEGTDRNPLSEYYFNILDSLSIGVAIVNRDGVYVHCNTDYIRRSNMSYHELIGKNVHYFVKNKISDSCLFDSVIETRQIVTRRQLIRGNRPNEVAEKLLIAYPICEKGGTEIIYVVDTDCDMPEFESLFAIARRSPAMEGSLLAQAKHPETIIYKSQLMENLVS